jgi:hypothetical protein
MIGDWLGRGERLARDRQQQKISEIAAELRAILGSSSVEVEEARVLGRGRGIIKRWLVDPSLRFLGGGLK